jgi:hypothetical protein
MSIASNPWINRLKVALSASPASASLRSKGGMANSRARWRAPFLGNCGSGRPSSMLSWFRQAVLDAVLKACQFAHEAMVGSKLVPSAQRHLALPAFGFVLPKSLRQKTGIGCHS